MAIWIREGIDRINLPEKDAATHIEDHLAIVLKLTQMGRMTNANVLTKDAENSWTVATYDLDENGYPVFPPAQESPAMTDEVIDSLINGKGTESTVEYGWNESPRPASELPTGAEVEVINYEKIDMTQLMQKIDSLEGLVGGLAEEKTALEGKVSTLESDNSTLNATVSTLESDSATLNTTVSQLGEDVIALSNANSTLEGQVSTLESDNVSLNETVSGLETDFGSLSSANDTLSSTVSTLEGNVATLTSDKEALEGQVSTLESTIADLTTRLEALENPTNPE